MKKTILLLLGFIPLFSLEIYLNSGKEGSLNVSVLHIKNNVPFECKVYKNTNLQNLIKCNILGNSKLIANQDLPLLNINFENREDSIDMIIYPKTEFKVINTENSLYLSDTVKIKDYFLSKDVTIVFYPYSFKEKKPNALNFDVIFPDLITPFVGGLDLDQNPVNIGDFGDISAYLSIKRYYENKQYRELLELCDNALNKYVNSIFTSEFYLYRLRGMINLLNYDTSISEDIIKEAKRYIREFASDESYPEVLQIMIKTYLKLEQKTEAEYFIDILNNEHPNAYYTKIASLNYADYLLSHNKRELAIAIYNNILFTSDNPTLASKAAIALAKINIDGNRLEDAKEFVIKVVEANKEFLIEEKDKTISLADLFYNEKLFDISANLYELIVSNSDKSDIYYERALKNLAYSLSKIAEFDKAEEYVKKYKKEFPAGEYLGFVEEVLDNMYFERGETDSFKLHEYYKFLMAKYNNSISERALKEEIKLLFKEEKYQEILEYKDTLLEDSSMQDFYYKSLDNLVNSTLEEDKCYEVLTYIKEYGFNNTDYIKKKYKYLNCLLRKQQYSLAYDFAIKYENEDVVSYRLVQAQIMYLEKNYKEVQRLINSLLNKRYNITKDEYFDIYYYLSLSLLKSNQYNDAIFALKTLEKYKQNIKLVEVYKEFLKYFDKHKLYISSITYGKKAIEIQNYLGINLYSPFIEMITIRALIEKERYQEAHEIFTDLLKLQLSNDEYSEIRYLEAEVYLKELNFEKAIESLQACKEGEWKDMCEQKINNLK